jgi:gliding motility-associated-like protein
MKLKLFLFSFLLIPFLNSAQTPTVQDCAGAIPICQPIYQEANSYIGDGNYHNEIDTTHPPATTCTDGEINDVWYTFTAQTSGNFSFILTPNNTSGSGDDYDWTVFDLTNATCSDIYSNSSLEISCNSWGSGTMSAINGPTGASSANGGSGNFNGPGTTNGPPFNSDIPVTAGNIYVMMVSNWSQSTYGYTIDFSSSSAQLFDNVPPQIHQITSNIGCGCTSITFEFSEYILCNTIAACDISLTGPGGPYTITNITGASCASGGDQEKVFTISFSPAITQGGGYSLNLDASSCNSVTDLCGNLAPSGILPFTVNLFTTNISTTPASCAAADGSATVTVTGGSGNYTYLWNTVPPQTTATISNVASGSYIVTITDGNCTSTATANVGSNSNLTASITSTTNDTCDMSVGSLTVTATGTSPYTYLWNTTPQQSTATAVNLPSGNYIVTVTGANGCTASATAAITAVSDLSVSISNIVNETCGTGNGSATVSATGTSPFTYLWNTSPQQISATAVNLTSGNYIVTVTGANGCTASSSAAITSMSDLSVSISNIVNETCGMSDGSATVSATGTSPFTYLWSTTPAQNTVTAVNLSAGSYTVTITAANGCSATLTAVIIVGSAPTPVVTTVNSHCDQADGSATASVTGGSGNYTYVWNTGDTTSTITNLVPGVYSVTVDDGYCDSVATAVVSNQHGPNADFTFHPSIITIDDAEVSFTSTSTGASIYEWDFGDSSATSGGSSVIHTYTATGTYLVTLVVTDIYGCTDTITQELVIHDIYTFYVPNCFTPDEDGLNDVFQAVGISWEPGTYEMIIYNRWGNIVYQTTDPSQPWNGGYNNNPDRNLMIPAVYVYRIKVKGYNNREMVYIGRVSLLK